MMVNSLVIGVTVGLLHFLLYICVFLWENHFSPLVTVPNFFQDKHGCSCDPIKKLFLHMWQVYGVCVSSALDIGCDVAVLAVLFSNPLTVPLAIWTVSILIFSRVFTTCVIYYQFSFAKNILTICVKQFLGILVISEAALSGQDQYGHHMLLYLLRLNVISESFPECILVIFSLLSKEYFEELAKDGLFEMILKLIFSILKSVYSLSKTDIFAFENDMKRKYSRFSIKTDLRIACRFLEISSWVLLWSFAASTHYSLMMLPILFLGYQLWLFCIPAQAPKIKVVKFYLEEEGQDASLEDFQKVQCIKQAQEEMTNLVLNNYGKCDKTFLFSEDIANALVSLFAVPVWFGMPSSDKVFFRGRRNWKYKKILEENTALLFLSKLYRSPLFNIIHSGSHVHVAKLEVYGKLLSAESTSLTEVNITLVYDKFRFLQSIYLYRLAIQFCIGIVCISVYFLVVDETDKFVILACICIPLLNIMAILILRKIQRHFGSHSGAGFNLECARKSGNPNMLRELMCYGKGMSHKKRQECPIFYKLLVHTNSVTDAALVVRMGFDINVIDEKNKETILNWMIRNADVIPEPPPEMVIGKQQNIGTRYEIFKSIMNAKADPNVPGKSRAKYNALHHAISNVKTSPSSLKPYSVQVDIIKDLIIGNSKWIPVNLDALDSCGRTPLINLVQQNYVDNRPDLLDCLLDAKANVNLANSRGETVIHIAASYMRSKTTLQTLIRRSENGLTKRVCKENRTPLHCIFNFFGVNDDPLRLHDVVKTLLYCNVDPNIRDEDGQTAMLVAFKSGLENGLTALSIMSNVEPLLEAKASLDISGNDGNSCWDMIQDAGYDMEEIEGLLLRKGIIASSSERLETPEQLI